MSSKTKSELYRKSIHISSIILPLSYRYIFYNNRKLTFLFLVPLTLIALIIEVVRLEHRSFKRIFLDIFGIMLREHEEKDFTGATYVLISSIICIAIFPADIAFVALSFLAIGDTLAALVGIKFGKRKIVDSKKSLEGSLACFTSSFIFALFFVNPFIAFFGSISAAISEFIDINLDDNLKIPISSGLIMMIVNIFI